MVGSVGMPTAIFQAFGVGQNRESSRYQKRPLVKDIENPLDFFLWDDCHSKVSDSIPKVFKGGHPTVQGFDPCTHTPCTHTWYSLREA